MKYPTHTIIDLKQAQVTTINSQWPEEFTRTAILPLRCTGTKNPLRRLALRPVPATLGSVREQDVNALEFQPTPLTVGTMGRTCTLPLFDIHFLRKERLYTKLKYSRCPQYDIVSGGFAAVFAGFIGFLISEKFGIELVDSGDFYTAFMYGVFATLSLKPLIFMYSRDSVTYTPLSPKYLLMFIRDLFTLSIRSFLRCCRMILRLFKFIK